MVTATDTKRDIQGFITSGFGHTYHAAYIFLRISHLEQAKSWLRSILPRITTAESWRPVADPCDPDAERPPKIYPEQVLNIALSFEGLAALGLSEQTLRSFPAELQQGIANSIRANALGDSDESDPSQWVVGGPDNAPFHIVLLLQAGKSPEDRAALDAFVTEISAGLSGLDIVHIEQAYRRADDKEQFGFRDGVAQPRIRGIHRYDSDGKPIPDPVATGEFILGYLNEYGLYPTVPVVPYDRDPDHLLRPLRNPRHVNLLHQTTGYKDLGANGSYLVYRKLRQHVGTFWQFMRDEAARLDGTATAERMVWLATKMVGRQPNGDPLVPNVKRLRHQDDFLFAQDDPDGMHCPFGSHLRRTNPRDMLHPVDAKEALATTAKHRIIRRGRIYGDQLFDLSLLNGDIDEAKLQALLDLEDDDAERGLHFFCVNANIQRQFEFIQTNWSNNLHFNQLYRSKDPIIGDNARAGHLPSQMPIPYDPVRIRTAPLPRFVTVAGGAYLFMPALSALRYLAS